MAAVQQEIMQAQPNARGKLIARFAERYGVDSDKLMSTLKATAFRQRADAPEITNEQMMALLIVAEQYGLNPWTKEIYAYPDKHNGIVPVVSVDGWSRIINSQEDFNGAEFEYGPELPDKHKGHPVYAWIECRIYRQGREHPTAVREFFDEVVRSVSFSTPWDTHPKRMHRHKTFIQCGRVAYGFVGIHDDDEAQRIIDGSTGEVVNNRGASKIADVLKAQDAEFTEADPAGAEAPPELWFDDLMLNVSQAASGEDLDVARTQADESEASGTIDSKQRAEIKKAIAARLKQLTAKSTGED